MGKEIRIQALSSEGNTIFHITERFLSERYDFRFNTTSKEIQVKQKNIPSKWKQFNENTLYIELQKNGIKCNINNLLAIVKSDFTPNFDPIEAYFMNLKKWDKGEGSYISKLCTYVKTNTPDQFELALKKWLVRAVKCALLPDYFNKQALILVHNKQNSGKSTLCRWICPPALSDYFAEDISDDKDSRIMLTTNFLINLDELSSLHRKEINNLKSMFSKDKINTRLPYDRKSSILNRICSFIGSTNLSEFLTDETGSVRWLCFEIQKIDWMYKEKLDINDIWREAYTLHLEGFDCALSKEEIQQNESRNQTYQQRSIEYEAIQKLFEVPDIQEQGSFHTATDVVQLISTYTSLKVNRTMVGRAITALKFPKIREGQKHGYSMIFNKPNYS
ncbi:MAG: VapE domain-containing protein [Pseudomonadota bacterium]